MVILAYAILAVFGWAMWAILNKMAVQRIDPVLVQISAYCVHIVLVPILISTSNFSSLKKDYFGILFSFSSAICSAIAAYFYARAVKGSDVSSVLSITTCYPSLAFILSVIFLGETFSLNKFFGFAIMILGAIIVNR